MSTMTQHIDIDIKGLSSPGKKGDWVIFTDHTDTFSPAVTSLLGSETLEWIRRAAKVEHFTGERLKRMTLTAPTEVSADRIVVIGLGKKAKSEEDR
jgi:hypothetical protein